MALTRQMPTTIIIPRDATREQSFRLWADVLRLWRLCGNASCRRCRACRGKSRACFSANYPLLPDGVREYFDALGQAHRDGLTFDDALEELDGATRTRRFAPGRPRSTHRHAREKRANRAMTFGSHLPAGTHRPGVETRIEMVTEAE